MSVSGGLEWTSIETLAPPVAKVAGPGAPAALRLMAAKGLAPLKPGELLTALYQLHLGDDEAVKAAALKTAAELPEKLLAGLSEPLDARVLDFFSRRVFQKPKPLELVLLNRATSDETFCKLAQLCNEAELELIARNEERLLRSPAIIAALYMNPKTRMSTAQRALELAVRNGVKVDIPAFEEAEKAILAEATPADPAAQAAADAAFKRAAEVAIDAGAGLIVAAVDPDEAARLDEEEAAKAEALATADPTSDQDAAEKRQRLEDLSVPHQIRAATLGNSFARSVLIRSKNKQVALACVKSPAVKETEVLHWATNRSLDEDLIRYIANKRQWTRLYGVKVALVNNPKCPVPMAMAFLPHLRPPDLRAIGRSKGVASAVANAAKQMLASRGGG